MLNANKSSFVGGSQYSTRRSLIKRLATLGFSVTVAGAGWSKSFQEQIKDSIGSFLFCLSQGELPDVTRFRVPIRPNIQNVRFSGIVADGNLFLQEHEFALVVENDPDYVSEKLFNALEAGCIPLYLGPRLRKLGIPESLIVDLGSETDSSLMSLRSDAARKDSIGKLGRSYIMRPDVQEYWSHEAGVKRFFEALRSRLSGQIGI
jgi:hypothetical protein